MKISANLGFLYQELPLLDAIAAAANDGFDGVEFHWPYDVPPDDLRRALAAAGIPGVALNTRRGRPDAGEFGLSALPGRQADAQRAITEAISYAAAAGLSAVHVMAGKANGTQAEAAFVGSLGFACDLAAQHGLTVLIEPINTNDVPGYFLSTTDQAARIVARVARPNLRVMYDFYHMAVMKGDHRSTLEKLVGLVGHVQIAAPTDRTEPEADTFDLERCLALARYDGFIGAEYKPSQPPGTWLGRFRGDVANIP